MIAVSAGQVGCGDTWEHIYKLPHDSQRNLIDQVFLNSNCWVSEGDRIPHHYLYVKYGYFKIWLKWPRDIARKWKLLTRYRLQTPWDVLFKMMNHFNGIFCEGNVTDMSKNTRITVKINYIPFNSKEKKLFIFLFIHIFSNWKFITTTISNPNRPSYVI